MMSGSLVMLRIQRMSSPMKRPHQIVGPSEHHVTYSTRPGLGIRLWTICAVH